MQKLWTITTNDLRTIFADRGIWINLIIVPVALAVVVGLANGAFAGGGADDDGETRLQRYRIDVINQDGRRPDRCPDDDAHRQSAAYRLHARDTHG